MQPIIPASEGTYPCEIVLKDTSTERRYPTTINVLPNTPPRFVSALQALNAHAGEMNNLSLPGIVDDESNIV
jgi:hypothetical protein